MEQVPIPGWLRKSYAPQSFHKRATSGGQFAKEERMEGRWEGVRVGEEKGKRV